MSAPFERVVIVGASGQLGSALRRAFAAEQTFAPPHGELDLGRPAELAGALAQLRPTLVINAAAFHQVDACEADPARAFAINALGVDALAAAAAAAGAAFAHVSTDYVFDGARDTPYDESDAARPLNVYGISKLAGERLAVRHGPRAFVFRTSGLYGASGVSNKGPVFVEKMLRGAERGEALRVVDDVVFSPSFAPHVAAAMHRVLSTERYGLYHLSDAGCCSWWEFAVEAIRLHGLEPRVEAVRSAPASGAARRPAFSALAHGALKREGFPAMPTWQEGLREYLSARAARQDAPAPASM
jgi:dTDP-4-dehydrorhamnose reductase